MSEPTLRTDKQTWVSAVIETTPDLAEQERLVRLYDYDELVNALLIEGRTLAAQLAELTRISDALGTNEGHSSVDHILAMKAKIDAQRTALLALADSIQEQGVRNAIREIVK